ncbi:MAG: C40 family peptidase [Xanthobacteraceae bacterium]|nr:C40 family peptidase [Xanthobacteraceae bacterium]
MANLDPRITPARPDLAAAHLRGKVEAARFVEGTVQEVIAGIAPVRDGPSHQSTQVTEALHGERVTVYETDEEGWAWGQLASDGYVGWIPAAALLTPGASPTHKVMALRTFVFPGPSIKLPPQDALPLGAQVSVAREQDSFAVLASGGYVPKSHLAALDAKETDFVAVAERLVGAPYLWGGKSSLGIDCSGLVQVALTACGIPCPRDSDMQEKALGKAVSLAGLQSGDLIFWKGHVAIARGRNSMIHANAFHMSVTIEPVGEAVARIAAGGTPVTSVRRLKP